MGIRHKPLGIQHCCLSHKPTEAQCWDSLEVGLELTWPRLLPQIPVTPETPNLDIRPLSLQTRELSMAISHIQDSFCTSHEPFLLEALRHSELS